VLTCVTALPTAALIDRDDAEITWVDELQIIEASTLVIKAVTRALLDRVWTKGVHTG
jgi:hypothetical protein